MKANLQPRAEIYEQPPPLPPTYQGAPMALFPQLVAQTPTTLLMRSDLWTSSATITNTASQPILRVESENFSMSHRKRVYDPSGTHLFTVRQETWRLGMPAYYAEHPTNGTRLLELKNKMSWGGSKAVARFSNALTGAEERLEMKGTFWGGGAVISNQATGAQIAQIDRKRFSVRNQYAVTVMPGVDVALVVAMCICLDDRERSQAGAAAAAGSA